MGTYEYKDIFLEEAEEQLDMLSNALLMLEKSPEDKKNIHTVFRVAHTLKSSSAFVGLAELSHFAHKVENLLQQILNDKIHPAAYIVDVLFSCFDKMKEYINLFAKGEEINIDFSPFEKKIEAVLTTEQTPSFNGIVKPEKEEIEKNGELIEVNVPLEFTGDELNLIFEEGIKKFVEWYREFYRS